MDYISREAAKSAIADTCAECRDVCLEFDGILADCNQCLISGLKANIHAIPAADVQEVKHGHNTQDLPSLFECSVCGWGSADTLYCDTSTFNYCPNCGAKMEADNAV